MKQVKIKERQGNWKSTDDGGAGGTQKECMPEVHFVA
jgi:hypothetical protein